MTKAGLRTLYKAKRQALSTETVEAASERISRRWQDWFGTTDQALVGTCVHVFLPIRSRNEVNTWPIIRALRQHWPTTRIVTSIADLAAGTLTHVELTPKTTLLTNRYGIPEPDPTTSLPVATSAIDLVLVPLLIFDQQGHRVGYGGGFYDRFLAQCRPDCVKVGLSLFEPVDQITDLVETDIRLDGCITPGGVSWF